MTPEFQTNIELLKNVPGVTSVLVEETNEHIERQLGGVDCYSVTLTNDNGKSVSMIVPIDLCHGTDFVLTEDLLTHFRNHFDKHATRIQNEQLSFFVSPKSQELIQLDGRKIITEPSQEQRSFIDFLLANVDGCLDVVLSSVIDPVLMEQTENDDALFMHFRVAGFIHPFGMILHESSYKIVNNHVTVAQTMRDIIFKAASEKL